MEKLVSEPSVEHEKTSRKKKQNVKASELMALLDRQERRCALSGEPLTLKNVTADHIQPVSSGGENTIENIQLVTRKVNRMKSTLTQEEFIAICCQVAKFSEGTT